MNYRIARAQKEDTEEILRIQKAAYRIEAERYNNFDIPPLTQTLEELTAQFETHTILKAVCEGTIVGTVRAYSEGETCFVGRLAVHPDLHNRGIGKALMQAIEQCFQPKRYELFVGSASDNNIQLYRTLGYTIYKKAAYECGDIDILYMEKLR